MLQIEASPLFRAGLPGKEDGHFCIAPLDPALPDGACGERAGQGAQILRNEAYLLYAAVTKDAAQHRSWTFCEAVIISGHVPSHQQSTL